MSRKSSPTIAQFMTAPVVTIGASQTIAEAARRMREHACRHLPVLVGGVVRGILSDRDIDLITGLHGLDSTKIRVDEAMVPDPYTVPSTTPLVQTLAEMAEHKYGTALVMEGPQVVGIFTTVDALAAFAAYLDAEARPGRTRHADSAAAAPTPS